ncbi:anthrone oxygenase family protein [Dongia deserti]|uniref:anthrone oxygenase family protein n=1 Tax=Dongia deserti TaxID=2268030 RepID=UPI0013C4283B|nr:anthrone oxygenase family protein [Dongia deserti]
MLSLALLASALIAGFFYTYSISVMPGLAVTEPRAAMLAMQGINATIRTPVFAFAFFGAFGFTTIAALLARRWAIAAPLAAAGLIYAAGSLALTFIVHVPMNEALALVPADADDAVAVWRAYAERWTLWNHARTAASILAFACVALAAIGEWRGQAAMAASFGRSGRAPAPAR